MNRLKALNHTFISSHLKDALNTASEYALTSVTAPMGYGKSTAINWFLDQVSVKNNCQVFRVNIYSNSTGLFWRGFQASLEAADPEIQKFSYPDNTEEVILLAEHLADFFRNYNGTSYLFLDDFHLLCDSFSTRLFCTLADFLPENAHLIIASRNRFLMGNDILRLGKKIHHIGTEELKLFSPDLLSYAHRSGVRITKKQAEELFAVSEGWFSVVYLNLRTYSQRGSLLDKYDDIYNMITEALIDPLSDPEKIFLAFLSPADEFTESMADFVTEVPDSDRFLKQMTENNAFIIRLPRQRFRLHHMLQYCASSLFRQLPSERQNHCYNLYGQYYETQEDYLRSLLFYEKAENYPGWLRVIEKDAGVMLASVRPENVYYVLDKCPEKDLRSCPGSLLVLMRRLFTWQQVPRMLKLKELLIHEVKTNPSLTDKIRGDLLGECDLIMSFLCYNDIAAMSKLHKSACAQMSGTAVSIRNYGSWTFGSPSVLMMFHRDSGRLSEEIQIMNEAMPYYYQVTGGHGMGAELVMEAESQYLIGRFQDAFLLLSKVRQKIVSERQKNMELCSDFLALRLHFFEEDPHPWALQEKKHAELLLSGNALLLNLFDSVCAYYYALMRLPDKIPQTFRQHKLTEVHYLQPAFPMMKLIENQVFLAQNSCIDVLGQADSLLALCRQFHYKLCEIHVLIQAAGACNALQYYTEAENYLKTALHLAEPDHLLVPFCENYYYIKELLGNSEFEQNIRQLSVVFEKNRDHLASTLSRPLMASALTDRELELARLIAGRLSNREIAATLYLSEGTIKQYTNRIYSKLHIEGDTRTKRQRLAEILKQ